MNRQIVGSLFAGVGGICQAFKQAKCDVAWANEIDESACITYECNHKKTNLIKKSIKDLSRSDINQNTDILTAGFPCQPFSQASMGGGFNDPRGQLFFDVKRLIDDLRPRAYFLENVRNLANHNGGRSFERVKEAIYDIGYSFIPFVLNASDYTDIPQNRERIYIVGFRDEKSHTYDEPTKENYRRLVDAPLSQEFRIPNKNSDMHHRELRSFLDIEDAKERKYEYTDKSNRIHEKIIDAVKDKDTFYQYRRYYVRTNKSNVCPTLTANMGGGGHNVPIILDGKRPRKLTPRECFNLQGFGKDFEIPYGEVSIGQLYRQAGNTVVIPMVNIIAKELVRVLSGKS
ncbi:MAG: DNA (cytosine-5-)-methyltransferase [Endozoicomonadaceae bacterium]|nr:DNA (cytosine-5-)-methyltransferase [Endozoicomonadaceae bacterium]